MSPTARTLRELRRRGYLPAVVERWNPGARVRQDLFGIIDVVGLYTRAVTANASALIGVQACVTGDLSKRWAKVASHPNARPWLTQGFALTVWGWSKRGARGKRKIWTLTERTVELWDLVPSDRQRVPDVQEL